MSIKLYQTNEMYEAMDYNLDLINDKINKVIGFDDDNYTED